MATLKTLRPARARNTRSARFVSPVLMLTALTLSADPRAQAAQGTYTNFETPQTHPIEAVTIGGNEYVLVCNTPNDSLEIWKATTSTLTFVTRIAVGLGPGTVRWNGTDKAYVCNFDGDSVSIVEIVPSGGTVTAKLLQTTRVGDEPADIAFNPTNTLAAVTLSSRSQVQYLQSNLSPTVNERLDVAYIASNGQYSNPPADFALLAVKMPRAAMWTSSDRLFVLNLMGGQQIAGTTGFVDLDLWRKDAPTAGGSTPSYIGQIGTTNHAFAMAANGSRMFIVGTRAQNRDPSAVGVAAVSTQLTGFVRSWMTVVDIPSSGNMSVRAEALAGTTSPAFPSINLNRNYTVTTPAMQEVATHLGVSQPTDIDLYESGGNVTRIAIAGFHSDNVAVLTPQAATMGGYAINRATLTAATGYKMVGPRGVAFNAAGTRVFVNGRFDNTLRMINTSTMAVTTVNLDGQDPTPTDVRNGRQFLYSSRFSRSVNSPAPIKSGFVSCASCHVDGRTDGLLWDLSDAAGTPQPPIPPALQEAFPYFFTSFPNPKGPMVTQTLQGLVNHNTNESFQFLATNAPYHWRADRADFTHFNEAFVNLQRMPNLTPAPADPTGLTANDMVTYRRFINSVRHPPNPEQSLERIVTGSLVNPNGGSTISGTGSLLGRALFHNFPLDAGTISCVDCHALPEGSTNTLTLIAGGQPLEAAAIRNVFAREAMIHTSTTPVTPASITNQMLTFPGTAAVANDGLLHAGILDLLGLTFQNLSINRFVSNVGFFNFMPGLPNLTTAASQMGALIAYVREFDSGTAPASGFAHTVTNTAADTPVFDLLEGQVREANIGLGVRARDASGVIRGFWFDPLNGGVYHDLAAPLTTSFTRSQLLASFAGAGRLMVLQGTPPGVERRWASATGVAAPIIDTANPPMNIQLEPMAPPTFHVGITDLTQAIQVGPPGSTAWAITTLHSGVAGNFGIPTTRRHEPPRRFRVSGLNIRPGARMFLFMQVPAGTPSGRDWLTIGMEMALVPTQHVSGGRPIWETEVEIDEQQTLALLNGGPFDPRVRAILDAPGSASPPTLPAPLIPNEYAVIIVNEDGTSSTLAPTPAPLFVQDTR